MKRKSIIAMVLASAVALSSIAVTGASAKVETNYGEEAYGYVQHLDENLNARIAGSGQETTAAAYIQGELESFGYEVTVTPFSYTRRNQTFNSQNIEVTKPGKSSKEIIVGSHYDSVGTHGVDDNGSGVAVNLETAKRMFAVDTPYTIKFVFFGAEEAGLRGSAAYADAMTPEQIQNTLLMINMDSILAGDYCYIYGGYVEDDGSIVRTWGGDQAKQLVDQLGLNIRLQMGNNPRYPSPTTGSWSDHASFWDQIPYVYFEAVNWDIEPFDGSGETADHGEIMHVQGKDDLTFINNAWPGRAEQTLKNYATLLPAMLTQLSPGGLITTTNKTPLRQVIAYADGAIEAGEVDQLIPSVRKTFLAAYDAAKAAASDPLADQESVMNAMFALITEIQKLDFVMGDTSVLQGVVDFANGIDLNDYISEGQTEFLAALGTANKVLADPDAMQYEIDPAFSALVDATAKLRLKADKSLLDKYVAEYDSLDLTGYSEESAAAFRAAMDTARELLADENLTEESQQAVNDAAQALKTAKEALVPVSAQPVPEPEETPAPEQEQRAPETKAADPSPAALPAVEGDTAVKNTSKAAPKTADASVPFAAVAAAALACAGLALLKRKK